MFWGGVHPSAPPPPPPRVLPPPPPRTLPVAGVLVADLLSLHHNALFVESMLGLVVWLAWEAFWKT